MTRKSQVWTMDLVAATTIFLITIVIFYIFVNNISALEGKGFDDLYTDSITVSSTLLGEGTPANWTVNNVTEIGLTNGNYRLNPSKVQRFASMNYFQSKLYLKTRFDYLLFFENRSNELIRINGIEFIGKPGVTKEDIKEDEDYDDLISIRRFLINGTDVISMVIYLWQ